MIYWAFCDDCNVFSSTLASESEKNPKDKQVFKPRERQIEEEQIGRWKNLIRHGYTNT